MATAGGSSGSRLGKDARPKYRGIKLFSGQKAKIGQILVRQKGTKFLPGKNVKVGKDYTLYAQKAGMVRFVAKKKIGFNKRQRVAKVINIES